MSKHKARIWAVIGASGSGKSAFVKFHLLKTPASRRRLLVWDHMREYGDMVTASVSTITAMVDALSGLDSFAVAFQPSFDADVRARQFNLFCRAAYSLGNCTMVVEELAFVTKPSWAPPAWSMVTCTGRHKGLTVIGCSQRPAQIDKNFLGNCSTIHCGRLNDRNDSRTMARVLMVGEGELIILAPLHYVERDTATGEIRRGVVQIPGASSRRTSSRTSRT